MQRGKNTGATGTRSFGADIQNALVSKDVANGADVREKLTHDDPRCAARC
jgi:hypothetical protein